MVWAKLDGVLGSVTLKSLLSRQAKGLTGKEDSIPNASFGRNRHIESDRILINSSGNDSEDVRRWLGEVCRGDKDAAEKLLARYRDSLIQLAAQKLGTELNARVDPSDIVQEAMLVAARELPNYARNQELPLHAWLYRLVWQRLKEAYRFHVRSQRRSVRSEQSMELRPGTEWIRPIVESIADGSSGPLSKIDRRERLTLLATAVEELSAENRELLRMKYDDGLTMPEIAEILGITLSAAKMRHLRILESLRNILNPDGDTSR